MKRISLLVLLFITTLIVSNQATFATPGDYDPTWNNGGVVTATFTNSLTTVENVNTLITQPDGKVLAGGGVNTGVANSRILSFIARYNPDGSLDDSFGVGGKVTTELGGNAFFLNIALQPDGKIVGAGYIGQAASNSRIAVFRFNSDGTPDLSFGFGGEGRVYTAVGGRIDDALDVIVQPDAKIVVVGHSHHDPANPGRSAFAVLRYNNDGNLDQTFGSRGVVLVDFNGGHNSAGSVTLQPDGKILVAGNGFNGSDNDFAVVRLLPSGELDESFGFGGKVLTNNGNRNDSSSGMVLQPDGKIVLNGRSQAATANQPDTMFVRYNPDGFLDTGFGNQGIVIVPTSTGFYLGNDLALQSDGKIIGFGSYDKRRDASNPLLIGPTASFAAGRFNADGSPDLSFGYFGSDGKVVATVFGNEFSFGISGGLQPDGKILIGGNTRPTGRVRSIAIVRLLND